MLASRHFVGARLGVGCLAIVCMGALWACSDNEAPTGVSQADSAGEFRLDKQIGVPGGKPDLVITSVVLAGVTTTSCGGTLPDVTCGQKSFQVTISNVGTKAVSGGSATVQLVRKYAPPLTGPDFPGPVSLVQELIPIGGSVTIDYGWWMGPCGEGCPIGFGPTPSEVHSTVDVWNEITELNETNNAGPVQSARRVGAVFAIHHEGERLVDDERMLLALAANQRDPDADRVGRFRQ